MIYEKITLNEKRNVTGRVSGRVHDAAPERADREDVALLEEFVKLGPVALESRALVEDLSERVLDDGDLLADADLPAEFLLNVWRRREMIRMDMRLEKPDRLQALFLHMVDDAVG